MSFVISIREDMAAGAAVSCIICIQEIGSWNSTLVTRYTDIRRDSPQFPPGNQVSVF
jgi:hypothetical protein